MLSYQTALDIALCYQELKNGKALLDEVEKSIETERRGREQQTNIRDAFGRPARGLELGIPGNGTTRLHNVPWSLARSAIIAHLADVEKRLKVLNEGARLELFPKPEEERTREEFAYRNDPERRSEQTPDEIAYEHYLKTQTEGIAMDFGKWCQQRGQGAAR
ncbi:hypothetical protein [Asticcacaulis sp.]|uniref:hypothetical protein n=1 Tax=Asticcacaulis sp. TaxID=1872648 RepID=UPI003F7BD3D1